MSNSPPTHPPSKCGEPITRGELIHIQTAYQEAVDLLEQIKTIRQLTAKEEKHLTECRAEASAIQVEIDIIDRDEAEWTPLESPTEEEWIIIDHK